MSHTRQDIRDAVVTLLSGATSAGTNVYANRETRAWESELPALFIYTKEETADPRDLSGRQSIRTLQLVVECKVVATENVDDDLDTLIDEVEDLLNTANIVNVLSVLYKNTEITLDSESETEKGVGIINYELKYIK
jgi:hypothetical protein